MNTTTAGPTPAAQLRTTVRPGPPRRVILAGELDVLTAARLEDLLTGIVETGSPRVEIDARDLRFCDAAGLGALVAVDEIAVRYGGGLTLTGAQPLLRRILRITGLHRRFPVGERTGGGRPA
jgi:anti-sigma B factor antagonist